MQINRIRDSASIAGHRPEIGHGTVFPEKRMVFGVRRSIGTPNDLATIVDPACVGDTPAQSAQVFQPILSVSKKGVGYLISCQVRIADDLAAIVHPEWIAKSSAERADVHHVSVFPKEWIHSWDTSRSVGSEAGEELACNLSVLIHKTRRAVGAAKGAEILHTARFSPAKRMRLGCCWNKEEEL